MIDLFIRVVVVLVAVGAIDPVESIGLIRFL